MWVTVNGPNIASFTGPTGGWTNFYGPERTTFETYGYLIRRGAGAPGYGVSWGSTTNAEMLITCWRGCKTSGNPYNVIQGEAVTTLNPANPNAPSVTTTVANCTIIALGCSDDLFITWTMPSGYTERENGDGGNTGYLMCGSLELASATTENPAAFGGGDSSGETWAVTVALEPA